MDVSAIRIVLAGLVFLGGASVVGIVVLAQAPHDSPQAMANLGNIAIGAVSALVGILVNPKNSPGTTETVTRSTTQP